MSLLSYSKIFRCYASLFCDELPVPLCHHMAIPNLIHLVESPFVFYVPCECVYSNPWIFVCESWHMHVDYMGVRLQKFLEKKKREQTLEAGGSGKYRSRSPLNADQNVK